MNVTPDEVVFRRDRDGGGDVGGGGGGEPTSTMRPCVSVVIPTYNRSWGLTRALQSVLAQTFQDYEIVVVDDASTDATAAVAATFSDPQIRYYRQPHNVGVASN